MSVWVIVHAVLWVLAEKILLWLSTGPKRLNCFRYLITRGLLCAAKCNYIYRRCMSLRLLLSKVLLSCFYQYPIATSIFLCIYVVFVCSCQTAGAREFAATRSQVEKYQRDFWWVYTVQNKKIKNSTWKESTLGAKWFWETERERKYSCLGTGCFWSASCGYWKHDREVTQPRRSYDTIKPSWGDIMVSTSHSLSYRWSLIMV